MENASQALIIAASVLIVILIASVLVYMARNMGNNAENIYSTIEDSEIATFNQPFLNFDGKENLNVQDVVTLINLANDTSRNSKVALSGVEIILHNFKKIDRIIYDSRRGK